MVLIEGKIDSKLIEPKVVRAEGIVIAETEYIFSKDYLYNDTIKEKTGRYKHSIGIKINNKKIELKCLPKENKYDITISAKNFDLFRQKISIFLNTYEEYIEKNVKYTYDELVAKATEDASLYQKENFSNLNLKVVGKTENITKEKDKINVEVKYKVEENIGKFQKTGES